jgi:serine/threonine protein kinase
MRCHETLDEVNDVSVGSGSMSIPTELSLQESSHAPFVMYAVEKELGKGQYGRVLQVRRVGSSESIALKEVLQDEDTQATRTAVIESVQRNVGRTRAHAPAATSAAAAAAASTVPASSSKRRGSRRNSHSDAVQPSSASDAGAAIDTGLGVAMPIAEIQQVALREVVLMKSIRHPYVLSLRGNPMFDAHGTMYVGCELMPGGNIREYLDKQVESSKTGAPLPLVRRWMYQLMSGLQALHTRKIFHRDLKPHNLLLDATNDLRIADFGLARSTFGTQPMWYTPTVITLWYRPPELIMGGTVYDDTADIWSCGAILFEMLTGRPLFGTDNTPAGVTEDQHQCWCIAQTLGPFSTSIFPGVTELPNHAAFANNMKHIPHLNVAQELKKHGADASFRDLLYRMLHYDPSRRPKAAAVLAHGFFDEERTPAAAAAASSKNPRRSS